MICIGIYAVLVQTVAFTDNIIGSTSLAAMGMILIMLPMFLLAMYERDGQPLEVFAKHFIETKFIRPKIRPYQTNNYYDALMRTSAAEEDA